MDAPALTEIQAKAILQAAPASVVSADPLALSLIPAPYVPPRPVWIGFVSFILAGIIIQLATVYLRINFVGLATTLSNISGQTVDTNVIKMGIAGIIGYGITWAVPPTWGDTIKVLTDGIIHAAQKDKKSKVSYVLPAVQPPVNEPPTMKLLAQKEALAKIADQVRSEGE